MNKPVLCLKSGRSPEGAKAVSSHTGSLAGSDSVYDALLVQSGVQRVETISELFDYAALYCTQPLPKGNRVGIITNAGGPGIMATDAAIRHGPPPGHTDRRDACQVGVGASGHGILAQPGRCDWGMRAPIATRRPFTPSFRTPTSIWG
ncbi:MAG: hypothetical protein ACOX52_13785 [Verrucomicrobiota bacterium]